ncbi:MAG: ferritin-like domain-containing protein [Deltaproteobacteria bacterium]
MKGLKTSKELLDLLNEAIAREIQVSVQYLWQHVQWAGVKGFAVKDELKKIAIAEMKHAEKIAERLVALGGRPTTKPSPILVGETLKEMLETDRKDEEGAIALYRKIVAVARKEGDSVTERMFQEILADEEDHYSTFAGLLEDL